MKTLVILVLVSIGFNSYAQQKNTTAQSLLGKWKAISKIETDKEDGLVTETEKEFYKSGEKTYEFTKKNTVIITQGFGKHQEELPFRSQNNQLFIGKYSKKKTPYVITFQQRRLKMVKSESKLKEGITVSDVEEVILER